MGASRSALNCHPAARADIQPDFREQHRALPEKLSASESSSCVTERIQVEEVQDASIAIAARVAPWESGHFQYVRKLQDASRNCGRVDLMQSTMNAGMLVAVKQMPNCWIQPGPAEFREKRPKENEQPWNDLAYLRLLRAKGFSPICDLLGVFRDDAYTYVVTTLASAGDLFGWCESAARPQPGPAREAQMLPLAGQIFAAVEWLHQLGVAHRDLSLENILLADGETIKIIDFGMATSAQECPCSPQSPGKASYQAPELFSGCSYDPFIADAFSLGVVLFTLAMGNYPWLSTKPGRSKSFAYLTCHGAAAFFAQHRPARALSSELVLLLAALLRADPRPRQSLEMRCIEDKEALSVWDYCWLSPAKGHRHQWRSSSSCSVSTMVSEGAFELSESE
eukprot:TRINITY_DN8818_c0_g1_i1.p1 TRINITY_DN8818_c0_g1~~TRINITY_DN8818_c0_g1_i1.p1  ORF type:complete len:418 (+),score=64.98 TRINITY_DN8818_c0_g1_i1:71-1255(+)